MPLRGGERDELRAGEFAGVAELAEARVADRFFTIPVLIPFRFHFGSGSRIFGSSILYDCTLSFGYKVFGYMVFSAIWSILNWSRTE